MDQLQLGTKNTEDHSQPTTNNPLIFISHDSRDDVIAEAFADLLTDVSGGILKSFRSSDRKGTMGIDFGIEWYQAIMEKLDDATDVVALLTPRSLNRPWILYESGVAKGKLNTIVLGLAIGIPLDQVAIGPFAQFQNCGDDEDSLTKLVLQLIRRHPQAEPRDSAIRFHVKAFLEAINTAQKNEDSSVPAPKDKPDDSSIAKLFEEIKILVRDIPYQVSGQLNGLPKAGKEPIYYDRWITFTVSLGDTQAREIYEIANPEYKYDEEGPTALEKAMELGKKRITEDCVIEEYPLHLLAHFNMAEVLKGTKFVTFYHRWKNYMIESRKDQYLRIDWWSEICNQITLAVAAYPCHEIEVPFKSVREESTWYLPVVTAKTIMPEEKKLVFSISLIRIPKDSKLIKIDADKFLENSKP